MSSQPAIGAKDEGSGGRSPNRTDPHEAYSSSGVSPGVARFLHSIGTGAGGAVVSNGRVSARGKEEPRRYQREKCSSHVVWAVEECHEVPPAWSAAE